MTMDKIAMSTKVKSTMPSNPLPMPKYEYQSTVRASSSYPMVTPATDKPLEGKSFKSLQNLKI